MISIPVEAGFRTITPDLIGFGKSDKFMEQGVYSRQIHLDYLRVPIDKLNLKNITLFYQYWVVYSSYMWCEPSRYSTPNVLLRKIWVKNWQKAQ
jgi:haloalkane dehalogenase